MRALVVFCVFSLPFCALAGDAPQSVLEENFETMKLDRLAGGVAVTGKTGDASIGIDDKKDRGKVVKLQVKKAGQVITLRFPLDHARISGKDMRTTYKALFPGKYEATKETWQRPRVVFTGVQDDGKNWYWSPPLPEPEKPDWQKLSGNTKVPEKLKSLVVDVQVPHVVAECWFDDLIIDINPGADPAPEPRTGNAPVLNPEEVADKAPTKTLEDAKMSLSSTGAKYVVKHIRAGVKGADSKKVLLVGPGVQTGKERFVPKATDSRNYILGPAAVTAPSISGVGLMQSLPDVLAEIRPGYVLIVGTKGRKFRPETEWADWADLNYICMRYGAVPILGLADGPEDEDGMRNLFRSMAANQSWPAIDLSLDTSAELLTVMLKLMDQYVLQTPEALSAANPKPKVKEIEE